MDQSSPDARIGWRIKAGLEAIGKTAEELHGALVSLGIADETIYAVDLCFEELALNILQHGGQSAMIANMPVEIDVRIEKRGSIIRLVLEDTAPHFDITSASPNRIDKPLSTVKPGGLGVHLVNNFASAIHYERIAAGNRLTLDFGGGGADAAAQ